MVYGWSRAGATLLGAALAGFLLWVAAQIGRGEHGRLLGRVRDRCRRWRRLRVSQLRGRTGHPPGMFLFGFVPVLIVAGWVLLGMQPHGNWFRSHVLSWSGDMHIGDVVHDVGMWLGVLAFGIGYTLGAVFEPAPRRRTVVAPVAATHDRVAADEPVAAERREVTEPVDERVRVR